MPGFFADIKGHFTQEFSGRYVAQLLLEFARHEPHSFSKLVGKLTAGCPRRWDSICTKLREPNTVFKSELSFDGAEGKRRSDFVALANEGPILYVEVKEDDVKSPRNAAQIKDYLEQNVPFILLSRFPPEQCDQVLIDAAGEKGATVTSIRYREVHRELAKIDTPIAKMLREFLEDENVGTYKPLLRDEDRQLAFFMTQLLGFPHSSKLGKLYTKEAVTALPLIVKRIFDNLEYVAEWVHQANRDLIRNQFTRRFAPKPLFKLSLLSKRIEAELENGTLENVDQLPGNGTYIQGGEAIFYAQGKIRSAALNTQNEWLYVWIGFGLKIQKGDSEKTSQIVEHYLYAAFWGNQDRMRYTESYRSVNAFPSEKQVLKLFGPLLESARRKAIKATTGKGFERALNEFRIPVQP